jgi:hypothetical protein
MNGRKLGVAELVIVISGAVLLIASFLDVYEDVNAWDDFLFPLFVLPALVGVLMAAHVLLTTFGGMRMPSRVLGLDRTRLHVVLGGYAALAMVCFLIGEVSEGENVDRGAGFWLMLLASIGLLVGAIMMRTAEDTGAGTADHT